MKIKCLLFLLALSISITGFLPSSLAMSDWKAEQKTITPHAALAVTQAELAAAATSLETLTPYPADRYFASQLDEKSKLIYDALTAEENLDALIAGEPITVGVPAYFPVPENATTTEYESIYNSLHAENERLGVLIDHSANAAAAFSRDRSDIFWTNGFVTYVAVSEDGVRIEGSYTVSCGKTYSIWLEVQMPLSADWDGNSTTDRSLTEDMATVEASVTNLATAARNASSSRYGQLQYINETLCTYNAYHTQAAAGGYPLRYPWTALSALDQWSAQNDENGSLKPVCEGYARALKLVCDELGIPCVLVSGVGNSENHMWNYVQMENGVWYAMDVTWNDTARTNKYFLAGKDVMNTEHTANSDFISSGQTVEFSYPVLSDTKYEYTTLTLTASSTGIVNTTVTLKLNGVTDPANAEITCNDSDYTPTANGDGTWTVVLPDADATYLFTARYTGNNAQNGDTAVCTIHTKKHTHSGFPTQGNNTQHKIDCICGQTVWENHTFDTGADIVIKEPDCTSVGKVRKVCPCGFTVEAEVPITEHNYTVYVYSPNCTQNGFYRHECRDCGYYYDDTETPATGHDFQNGACSKCGTRESGAASGGSPFGCSLSVISTYSTALFTLSALILMRKKRIK